MSKVSKAVADLVETEATSKILGTASVKDYMKEQGFIEVAHSVRVNTNGYPYITFVDKDNVAENIYFSKSVAQRMDEGVSIGRGFFNDLQILITENAEGEERVKIGSKNRVSIEDLF